MEISQLEEAVAVAIAMSPERLPGCDHNHWLIVVEFPKDPSATREQMIDTYLNTLATVLGSMEEAKKNMHAFSTTTYTGFSALLTKRHLRNSRDCLVFSVYCQTHT